jgi:hypothetical protein
MFGVRLHRHQKDGGTMKRLAGKLKDRGRHYIVVTFEKETLQKDQKGR